MTKAMYRYSYLSVDLAYNRYIQTQMGHVTLTRATGCHQRLLEIYPWWNKHFLEFLWWFQGPCSLIHNSSIRNILCRWNVSWFYAFSIKWLNDFIGKTTLLQSLYKYVIMRVKSICIMIWFLLLQKINL